MYYEKKRKVKPIFAKSSSKLDCAEWTRALLDISNCSPQIAQESDVEYEKVFKGQDGQLQIPVGRGGVWPVDDIVGKIFGPR